MLKGDISCFFCYSYTVMLSDILVKVKVLKLKKASVCSDLLIYNVTFMPSFVAKVLAKVAYFRSDLTQPCMYFRTLHFK